MSYITRNLVAQCTYWAPTTNGEYGVSGFSAPIIVMTRWEDRVQKVMKPSGEEVMSQATVFVDTDLAIGGYLAQGDQTASSTPYGVTGANEILQYKIVPNLRNNMSERRAFL